MIRIKEKNFAWCIDISKEKSIAAYESIQGEIMMHVKKLFKEVE